MKNETKHTAGPWERECGSLIVMAGEVIVADCTAAALPESEQAANASLTAAAPELLEMVQEYQNHLSDHYGANDTISRIEKLIAKAEGK